MTSVSRAKKLDAYRNAYQALEAALEEFPREMWQFRDEHGCWSIHEHLVHIADSEANSYIRCRRLIAEPGLELMAYDENQWASALNYHSMDTEGALELFRVLRRRTWELIHNLPESAWSNTCYHPENGDMTLEDWLDVYERHVAEHVEYMRQNHAEWLKAGVDSSPNPAQ
ncbi:MAG: DinB family protein [Chloroflexota bacterium]|nr:DinB family protein [Chloroflexota bacterium]